MFEIKPLENFSFTLYGVMQIYIVETQKLINVVHIYKNGKYLQLFTNIYITLFYKNKHL